MTFRTLTGFELCTGLTALLIFCATSPAQNSFVHFESPHVHPLEMTPDGSKLVAVNTVDARVEVFDVLSFAPYLRHAGSIAVGVEPITVRARNSSEGFNSEF